MESLAPSQRAHQAGRDTFLQAPKRPGDLWPSQQNPDSQTLPLAGAPRVPAFSSAYLTQGKAFGRENALLK